MRIYYITSEHASDTTIRCGHCWDADATHIEVDSTGKHDPFEHLVLCRRCIDLAGLEVCPLCEMENKALAVAGSIIGQLTFMPEGPKGHRPCGRHLSPPLAGKAVTLATAHQMS